jgi:hypothetical protein
LGTHFESLLRQALTWNPQGNIGREASQETVEGRTQLQSKRVRMTKKEAEEQPRTESDGEMSLVVYAQIKWRSGYPKIGCKRHSSFNIGAPELYHIL